MKAKYFFFIAAAVITAVSGCAQAPDSVKDRNNSKSGSSENQTAQTEAKAKCSAEEIWDGVDAAYAAGYTKFTLPEKDTLLREIPEGVYNAELANILEDDEDWFSERLIRFEDAMGLEVENEPVYYPDYGCYIHEDEKHIVVLEFFGRGAINWEDESFGILDQEYLTDSYILNRNTEITDDNLLQAVKIAEEYSTKAYSALENELESKPCDAQVYNIDGENYYSIDSQNYYKGIGIDNITCRYGGARSDPDKNGNINLFGHMSNNVSIHSGMKPQSYNVSFCFKKVKEEKIDEIISFKGACDILEQELSDSLKTALVFDDVKLWYEAIGEEIITSEQNIESINPIVTLTPKWYFIIDDVVDNWHCAYCVTVDCQSGEIETILRPSGV